MEELIPGDHLVRVVNRVIEQIEIKPLLEKHKEAEQAAIIHGGC